VESLVYSSTSYASANGQLLRDLLQSEMTGLALILQDEFQGDSVSGSTVERVLPGLRQEEFHRVIAVEVL
jgi:hypothetical protein